MDRNILSEEQLLDELYGDVSDIEIFDEDDSEDELAAVSETWLEEMLNEFENHNQETTDQLPDEPEPQPGPSSEAQPGPSSQSRSSTQAGNNSTTLQNSKACWRKIRNFTFNESTCDLQLSDPPEEL